MSALIGRSVDRVIDNMDIDHIISKIDIDRVVSRIDINKLLDSVDLDRQIARIDINAILERTDINAVLERSNLEEIVARSSSGIVNQLIDLIRINIVKLDLLCYRIGKCACTKKEIYIPPKPGKKKKVLVVPHDTSENSTVLRRSVATRIVEVQGSYSGVVSRGVSWVIDETISILSFSAIALMMEAVAQLIKDNRDFTIDRLVLYMMYLAWDIHLKLLCLLMTRRTIGMGLVGLKLVNDQGQKPLWYLIFLRQYVQPMFSKVPGVNGLALLWAMCRSDGKFPFDLVSCTGCVYSWNVSMAKLRLSRRAKVDGEDYDDDDDSQNELFP